MMKRSDRRSPDPHPQREPRRARKGRRPSSKLKVRITEVLKEEGFVKNFRFIEDGKQGTLRVYLKYGTGNEKIISGLVRVSKPGRRMYVAKDKVPHHPRRDGRGHPLHVAGRHDGPRDAEATARRRSPRLRVVGDTPCHESARSQSRFPKA